MKDYGFNPLGDGKWELIPSKTIVDKKGLEEFKASRPKKNQVKNDCLGLSWEQIEAMQGGKLRKNI